MNVRLHFAMHEIVANQLAANDPPEVYLTARRLLESGYDRHEVLHMLGNTMSAQIHAALVEHRPYDAERHFAALHALPGSWEQQRAEAPGPPPNRAERRAHSRRRHRPG